MRILSVGPFSANNFNNTSVHRSRALKKYASTFKELDTCYTWTVWGKISNKLISKGLLLSLPDPNNLNVKLIDIVKNESFDLIWIDKGNIFSRKTLLKVKELQPHAQLVHYMIDDFMNPNHKTKQIMETIDVYDHYIVNRKENIKELKELGCKHPIFTFMSYESSFHYPRILTDNEKQDLAADVGFIGTYEKERADSICYLAKNGIKIRVFGNGWNHLSSFSPNLKIEGKGLYSDDFCKAMQAFKINLGFLRKKSRDYHTTRSTEIPACGGFMLAERTDEHLTLFEEGSEAEFFSSNKELLEKCNYYLTHDEDRTSIAKNGTLRCKNSGYDNAHTLKNILNKITNNYGRH